MSAELSPSEQSVSAMSIRMAVDRLHDLQANVERVFQGKTRIVRLTMACALAQGHLLLEDVPGVGKTTLALALARSLGLSFQRIQFTSDLLPSDILGVSVYSPKTGEFDFKAGPLFAGVILADEINRTTPRTQSALLEAMSEGRVSIENVTHELPRPFLVIATQNPLEHHGTYPLPESQLDRFMMRLSIGYPGPRVERNILLDRRVEEPVNALSAVLNHEELSALQRLAESVKLDESLADYIMTVVEQTRRDPRVRIGVSTRGAIGLTRAARAMAVLQGRDYCIPDDVRELFVPCLAHRISVASGAGGESRQFAESILEQIVAAVPTPS
ncbi:MAG: MoxR family ATPase [Bradymonadaceae bacterium]|nr:MoxR family ATPase [Lujinxingiaceae bacterium]